MDKQNTKKMQNWIRSSESLPSLTNLWWEQDEHLSEFRMRCFASVPVMGKVAKTGQVIRCRLILCEDFIAVPSGYMWGGGERYWETLENGVPCEIEEWMPAE